MSKWFVLVGLLLLFLLASPIVFAGLFGDDNIYIIRKSSSGGNPFDQNLNTTNDVVFSTISAFAHSGTIFTGGSFYGDGSNLTGVTHQDTNTQTVDWTSGDGNWKINLNPFTNAFYNIGSATYRWLTGYFVDLNVSHNVSVDGNVSATYFKGNGSLLTGLSGGSQTPWTSDINAANKTLYNAKDVNATNVYESGFGVPKMVSGIYVGTGENEGDELFVNVGFPVEYVKIKTQGYLDAVWAEAFADDSNIAVMHQYVDGCTKLGDNFLKINGNGFTVAKYDCFDSGGIYSLNEVGTNYRFVAWGN